MTAELHGLLAEFDDPDALLRATSQARDAGYKDMDAYAPWPVEGLSEAVGFPTNRVALLTLLGGITGGCTGFFMQGYAAAVDYPINVGGRPLFSWPAFIPITFELTVLFAGLTAGLGMLLLNRLPEPYHPVFNHPEFTRASQDRFFLCIEARDRLFDPVKTRKFLEELRPEQVLEVPLEDAGNELEKKPGNEPGKEASP